MLSTFLTEKNGGENEQNNLWSWTRQTKMDQEMFTDGAATSCRITLIA